MDPKTPRVRDPSTLAQITNARLTAAGPDHRRTGLLGWASFTLGDLLVLDAVAVRRSQEGRIYLAYPDRRDGAGKVHPLIRPADDEARRAIESAVLQALSLAGGGER